MTTVQKLEALKYIATTHRDQFIDRRKYEWKIVFTVLTFYALAVVAGQTKNMNLGDSIQVNIIFVGVAVITSIYLLFIHRAHFINKTIARRAEDAIILCVGDQPAKVDGIIPSESERKLLRFAFAFYKTDSWSWLWQTTILLVFALGAARIISSNQAL